MTDPTYLEIPALLSQEVSLVIHGNAYLQGHQIEDLGSQNEFFSNTKRTQFLKLDADRKTHLLCGGPNEWFDLIQQKDVRGLTINCIRNDGSEMPDRTAVAWLGGGPRWLIDAIRKTSSDIYEGYSGADDKPDANDRHWWVEYILIGEDYDQRPRDHQPSLDDAIRTYLDGLSEIKAFARDMGDEFWAGVFDRAAVVLSDSNPIDLTNDFGPDGFLSENATRALMSCNSAWVFGAMGSWNDQYYEDEKARRRYDEVSDRFFYGLTQLIEVAANTSLAPNV